MGGVWHVVKLSASDIRLTRFIPYHSPAIASPLGGGITRS